MEEMRQQITALSHKVDSMYKIIEHLNEKLSDSVYDPKLTERQGTAQPGLERITSYHSYSSREPVLEHKDVLLDDYFSDKNFPSLDKELTADIQIQRLTAQLTAAYSRIAALEEQLLARRIHS